MLVRRRNLLAGAAAIAAVPQAARAQVKPRVTFISQWSSGSDGAAISGLGKRLEEEGGIWQHSPVPGFTTEMMNKLRADIIAGNPPAASQLKGPEIAVWSKIAPTVNLDPLVAAAGYEKLIPSELVGLHKPQGHWIALPMQVYRTTTLFMSKPAMKKVGATKAPKTWAEFNELATAMKAAGITPVANGGIRWDDGMKLEIALSGISCEAYRGALMKLDPKALKGAEMLEAFAQLRKFANWMDPAIAAQHYSVNLPKFLKGDMGMLMMGGWAQGVIKNLGGNLDDVLITSVPQNEGKPVFVLNADSMIFWAAQGARPHGRPAIARQAHDAEGRAGEILADHRLDPGAHRRRPFRPGVDRRPARGLRRPDRVLQEPARAAQPCPQHGADQPDHRRDDRCPHRIRAQRQGDARAGSGAARPGRG